jgi:hypothetical protein
LVALLAAILASGCLTHPAPSVSMALPAAQAQPNAPRSLDWRQADCEAMTWTVPVQATSLQPYLPEGFQPQAMEGPAGVDGAAWLGFRAVECSTGFGQDKILRSVQSGLLFTPVVPPASLREERFGARYEFGWDALVAPDQWRAHAASWGLPLHDGGTMVGPSAQGWSGNLAMDHTGAFAIAGRTIGAGQPAADYEARTITVGTRGFALWDHEVANLTTETGVGLWTVSPESWVAQVLGATQGVASFEHTTFDLPSAFVHWPGEEIGPVDESPSGPAGEPPVSLATA